MFVLICNFSINENRRINITNKSKVIYENESFTCEIFSRNKTEEDQLMNISDSSHLTMKCSRFSTFEEALNYSNIVFTALNNFGYKYNVRIIKDVKNLEIPVEIKSLSEYPILENDAVLVYRCDQKPKIISSTLKACVSLNDDEKLLADCMKDTNGKLMIMKNENIISSSLESFNSTVVESNPKLKLLGIIMSLEILTNILNKNEKVKSEEEIKLIDKAVAYVKDTDLNNLIKNNIASEIGKLKAKSIKKQLVTLLLKAKQPSEILGYTFEGFVTQCYRIRSWITHGSDFPKKGILEKYDLNTVNNELKKISINLIDALPLIIK